MGITSNHDECRYNLQRLCPAHTVFAGAGCQEFCPMLAAAAHQTFEFCSSDDDCPSSDSSRSIPATLRLESRDALSHAELTAVSYRIYSHFGSDWNGCSGSACGNLVTTLDPALSGGVTLVPGGREYLIVATKQGYYTAWTRSFVGYAGHASSVDLGGSYASLSIMTRVLRPHQQRFVLRWAHTGDLDLWVMNNSNVGHGVGYGSPQAVFGQGNASQDYDSLSGQEGPESTLVQSASPGALSVWVHANGFDFSFDIVRNYPATVDVYCGGCSLQAQQHTRVGWVSTERQRTQFLPVPHVRWWRAGDLVTAADGSVRWEPCPSYCFGPSPVSTVMLSLTSINLPLSQPLPGPISYTVYHAYSDVDACVASAGQAPSCGTTVGACSVAHGDLEACQVVLPSDSLYLLRTESAGFLPNLREVYVGMRATSAVSGMLPVLQTGQNRVVLRWGHTGDMDLWAVDVADPANRVGWTRRSATFGQGEISLDRDVREGPGSETLQLAGLRDRAVEIWVNFYGGASDVARVAEFPASVDVYCQDCSFQPAGGALLQRSGYVATLTQEAADIATPTYRWWKVGQFVADAGGAILWERCGGACYSDSTYIYQAEARNAPAPSSSATEKAGLAPVSPERLRAARGWRKVQRRAGLASSRARREGEEEAAAAAATVWKEGGDKRPGRLAAGAAAAGATQEAAAAADRDFVLPAEAGRAGETIATPRATPRATPLATEEGVAAADRDFVLPAGACGAGETIATPRATPIATPLATESSHSHSADTSEPCRMIEKFMVCESNQAIRDCERTQRRRQKLADFALDLLKRHSGIDCRRALLAHSRQRSEAGSCRAFMRKSRCERMGRRQLVCR